MKTLDDMPQIKVLLVEDCETDALIIGAQLRRDGRFVLVRAGSLHDAAEALRNGAHIDVVVLDLTLPDSIGLQTFFVLHQAFPDAPIVILSGHEDESLAIEAVRQGAQDYVPKQAAEAPLLVRSLLYAIERNGRRLAEKRNLLIEHDLSTARQLQQHLLPTRLPHISGFDIAATCLPADACGGDFFDIFPVELIDASEIAGQNSDGQANGRIPQWDLLIADVSGHGFGPAMVMVGTRRILRACALMHADIGKILTIANQAISEDTLEGQFVTLFYGRLDPANRTLSYASAGHPAWILTADGQQHRAEYLGVPIGVWPEVSYELDATLQLHEGDILLLMTDGAWECFGPGGQPFTWQRAVRIVQENRQRSAQDILGLLSSAIHGFCQPGRPTDDVTLMLIKVGEQEAA